MPGYGMKKPMGGDMMQKAGRGQAAKKMAKQPRGQAAKSMKSMKSKKGM
jgi:hypothetical protein